MLPYRTLCLCPVYPPLLFLTVSPFCSRLNTRASGEGSRKMCDGEIITVVAFTKFSTSTRYRYDCYIFCQQKPSKIMLHQFSMNDTGVSGKPCILQMFQKMDIKCSAMCLAGREHSPTVKQKEPTQQQQQPLPMARATKRSGLPFPLCGLAAHGSSTPTGGG